MTELSFAKSFLASLDARPSRLPADHTTNPKSLEIHGTYLLPRLAKSMQKPIVAPVNTSTSSSSNQSNPSRTLIDVSLSATKASTFNALILREIDVATTTVLDLKQRVAERIRAANTTRIKILHEKKPVADIKTVKDVLGGDAGIRNFLASDKARVLDLGVMLIGGGGAGEIEGVVGSAATGSRDATGDGVEPPSVKTRLSGREVLAEESFWTDLAGFLMQRVRDEDVAKQAAGVFRQAWEKR